MKEFHNLIVMIGLIAVVAPSAHATSADVDTATQTSTGFETKANPPTGFDICTYESSQSSATAGSYLGQNCLKLFWQESGYDGTRDGRGIELCGGGAATKEGWGGFKFYPPSPGYPNDKDAGIGQVFQGTPGTGCSSWALMLEVQNGVLYINHRHACVTPTRVQLGSLNYNAWNTVIVHYVASHLNAGMVQVWFNNTTQSSPTYSATNINFGFGAWDANDNETGGYGLGEKFGMYNYDDANYTAGETRTIYYDNICKLTDSPTNAWDIANPGIGSPGGLLARNTGSSKITVSWLAVNSAASYNIYRALNSSGPYTALTNVTAVSFDNTGLTNGITYYYMVTATNAAGEGPSSAPVSATANPGADNVDTVIWTGNMSGDWDIDLTANWQSNSTSLVYLDGDYVTFNDFASVAMVNLTDTVSPGTMTVSNNSLNYTFTSSAGDYISGATSLTKNGTGFVLFANQTNYFGGGLAMNSGTIDLGAGAIGAGPVTFSSGVISNGTLTASTFSMVNATVRANLAGLGSTLIVNGNGTTTLLGTNNYSGATTIAAGSTLILAGNNSSVTGTITDNGTLELLNSPNALGASQVATVANGNTVYLKADTNTTFIGGINANFTINFNVDQAVAGISNSILTLNGPLTWLATGDTLNVNGGHGYNLGLGDLLGSTATLNANTASLTIHSYHAFGNSSSLTFTGAQNIDVTAGITNANTKGLSLNFNGTGKIVLWGTDSLTGGGPSVGSGFAVNSGTVVLNNSGAVNAARGNVTVGWATGNGADSGAKLLLGGADASGQAGGITLSKNIVVQDGGATPNIGPMIIGGQNISGTNIFSGTITLGATANIGRSANLIAVTGGEVDFTGVIATNGTDTGAGITVGGSGNSGVVKLTAANTYAGGTVVSAGVLCAGNSSGSATGKDAVAIYNGGTLAGRGIVSGALTVQSGGTLAPGNSIGTLTVNNTVTLQSGSTTLMEINRTNTPNSDKLIANSISAGGTLTVTNLGSTNFVAGDTFTLFNSAVSGFSATNLPPLPFGKFWVNRLAIDGSIVIGAVNTTSTNIIYVVSGGNLILSWPTDHTGWTLQAQINSLSTGLGANWVNVAGSSTTNQMSLPISSGNGSVFYRLVYP